MWAHTTLSVCSTERGRLRNKTHCVFPFAERTTLIAPHYHSPFISFSLSVRDPGGSGIPGHFNIGPNQIVLAGLEYPVKGKLDWAVSFGALRFLWGSISCLCTYPLAIQCEGSPGVGPGGGLDEG